MFRFTIRDVLWLTVVVAMSLGVLCAFPITRAVKQANARAWVAQQGGHVTFSHKYNRKTKTYDHAAELATPSWLVAWFGIDVFDTVDGVILDNQPLDDLQPIVGLKNLRTLSICIDISDDLSFTPLAELERLEELNLRYTGISEARLQHVRELLPNVRVTTD